MGDAEIKEVGVQEKGRHCGAKGRTTSCRAHPRSAYKLGSRESLCCKWYFLVHCLYAWMKQGE